MIKDPHQLPYLHETWWKWLPHEAIIFNKFHKDLTKIVDFLLEAKLWTCPVFFCFDNKKDKRQILKKKILHTHHYFNFHVSRSKFSLMRPYASVFHHLKMVILFWQFSIERFIWMQKSIEPYLQQYEVPQLSSHFSQCSSIWDKTKSNKIDFKTKLLGQACAQPVGCFITPRKYPRSEYFLVEVMKQSNHLKINL